ncbi:MAG: hypothetical protein ACTSVY_05100 [Candidatus Helarchaeota archaeon]
MVFILNYRNFAESKSRIERNVSLTQLFMIFSFILFIYTLLFPNGNLFFFQLIPFINVLVIIYGFYVYYGLIDMSGNPRSFHEKVFIMGYCFVGLIISSILNYSYINIVAIENRIYYGLNIINIVILPCYLAFPLIFIAITSTKEFLATLTKESKKLITVYFYTTVAYIASSISMMLILELRIIFYIINLAVGLYSISLFIKKPKILIKLGSALGIRSIYIVRNNGTTIYNKDFIHSQIIDKTDKNRINLLIGGFVYAISHGIREIIRREYETNLKSMNFGLIKLIFGYGEKTFGVLFTTAVNDYLEKQLTSFIHKFEEENKETLDTWIGDITYMSKRPKKGSKNEEFVKKTEALIKEFFQM